MAEARREIVTALKFHRAAMKQANEQQQHEQPPPPPSSNSNPNIYQQNQPTFSNPSFTPFTYPSLPWSYSTLAPLPDIPDNLNLPLPNTPLGLNLNFQAFTNIDTPLYNSNTLKDPPLLPLSPHSSSSSSYSYSSPSVFGMEALEAQTVALGACDPNIDLGDQKLHLAMDEKEMAEIRSIGEKHDIEWNDTVNLVTSAWWSKFLETMEGEDSMEVGGFQTFEEAVDIPSWLKDVSAGDANASHLLMQHLDDYYLKDASLPW